MLEGAKPRSTRLRMKARSRGRVRTSKPTTGCIRREGPSSGAGLPEAGLGGGADPAAWRKKSRRSDRYAATVSGLSRFSRRRCAVYPSSSGMEGSAWVEEDIMENLGRNVLKK